MQGFGLNCIKYLLFIFNCLVAVAGLGIIVACGLALAYVHYDLLQGESQGPTIALLVVGVFIFITAFLGCCGAIKENYCMLISFSIILIIIFIVQMAVGISAAVYKDKVREELSRQLNDSLVHYKDDEFTRKAWEEVQKDYKCCGINGPEDWNYAGQVPSSCCLQADSTTDPAHQTCSVSKVAYKEGCYEKLAMQVKDGLIVTMAVGIGIAFIELAGAILACFLAKSIQKESEVS